ncbi:right-handed parallel beta-helix repeat-containing protein [Natronorubrum thiooxidans]|uniref:right-handed parallel beta-helix repeat-containing protein n=1 Tax=Natronorubrum thiooxidans TaxID=308853 RepID=UPI00097167A0|nr:right-handed parallel beta-helix repeat-containing protein [Natronorubrum thiooxidans]
MLSVLLVTSIMVPFVAVGSTTGDGDGSSLEQLAGLEATSDHGTCVVADESIQDAIDAASPGETICVGDGTYQEALFIDKDDLTLIASDGSQPVLDGSDGVFGHGIHVSGATGVTIDGVVVQGFEEINGLSGIGIYLQDAHEATVRNTEVRNNDGGILNWNGDDVTIESNTLTNNAQGKVSNAFNNVHGGIHLSGSSGNTIENNDASGNHETNIYVRNSDDATVRGNTVTDAPQGQQGSIYVYGSTNALIEANTVTDNVGGDLRRGIGLRTADGPTVTDNHLEGNQGTALHVRSSNDVSVSGNTITNNQNTGLFVTGSATNTVLEGNTVDGNDGHGIRVQSDGVIVRDNDILENELSGVSVSEAREVIVRSNVIADSDNSGVAVFGSTSTAARNGLIEGNTVSGSGGDGIWISGPRDVTVRGNDVTTSSEHGIHAIDAESVVIDENDVSGSQRSGIKTDGAVNVTVTKNTVTANADTGILVRDTVSDTRAMAISENTATDNVDGVRLEGSNLENVTVEANRLEENTNGVTIADTPSSQDALRINENVIQNNANRGINHETNQLIDITSNWWGDASGPSGGAVDRETGAVADGLGDSIEHDSHDDRFWFDPWLTTDVGGESDPVGAQFDIEITDTNEPITAGETLVVTATVTNMGDQSGTETVELIADDGATGLDSTEVTLGDGESEPIDLSWETTGDDTGVFDLSVVSPYSADTVIVTVDAPSAGAFFAVTIDDTNEPIAAGDTLEVSTTIANIGDAEGTQTIEFVAFDGTTVVDSTSLTLAADATETLVLSWSNAPDGTGDVTVRTEDDSDGRTVAIGAATAVEITSCRVIDTAGNYVLSSDLSGDDTCITITASDVSVDGGGHTIAASNATGNDWGVHVTGVDGRVENVSVTNLVLEGWGNGVRFRNVDDSELSNVVVENGSTGVVLSASHGNTLNDLTIRDNNRRALSLSSSDDNVVSDVEATGNEAATTFSGRGSVYLFGSSNNEFEDVVVTDGRSGVRISFSTGNEFVGLTTERHANYGLEVQSNSNTFTDVVANDNGWHGIQVNTASFNAFENVTVTGTDGSAVRLTGIGSGSTPQNNVFENVSVTDNDGAAVSLSVANYNTFRDLTTASNTGSAVTFVSRAEGNLVEFGEIGHGINTAVNFGSDSVGNTVREVSLNGTGTPFVSQDGGPNNEFDRVDIDGTVVSLSARGVGTSQVSPSTLPADSTPLGSFLRVTPHSSGTTHVEHLRFHYEAADVESLDENALAIWRLVDGEWIAPTDATYVTGVDTDQQYVFATGIDESHLSATFGVFATGSSTDPGDGDSSGSSGGGGGSGAATPADPEPEPDAPFFTVSIVETTSPVTAGETLDVTAVVENVGAENGTGTVELLANGAVVDSASTSLSAGDEVAIELSWATTADDVAETSTLEVRSDDDAATAVVTVNPVDEDAEIVLYGARAQSDTVDVGDTLTVVGDFYNLGTTGGERTVTLFVDGEAVDDATVTVSPGLARGAAELTWTPTEDDISDGAAETEFTLSLDGLLVGTVTVDNPYSDIQVIAASSSSTELVAGEEAYVVGSIYQAGTIAGSETFDLVAENVDTGEEIVLGSQESPELAPGFYYLGALNVSYAIDEPGTYDLRLGDRDAGSVEAEAAYSDVKVIAASTSEIELVAGEEAYVVGSIYQAGTIAGTETFDLIAENVDTGDEIVLGSQESPELAPGWYHLGALNISYTIEEAGTYDITLGDQSAGTVEVEAAYSDILVIGASTSEVDLVAGEEAHVVGSIYQAGTIEAGETVDLVAENAETGEEIVLGSQESPELAPGFYYLGALNVSYTIDEAGTYDLRLGNRDAGTVEVEAAYSDITVIAASSSVVEFVAGEEAYVVGSIYQAGTIEASETFELTAENVDTGEEFVLGTQESPELAPGYYYLGALNVSYTIDEAGTYDLTLGDRPAGTVEVLPSNSDIRVTAASVEEIELVQGETTFVTGSIYQAGTDDGPQRIVLEERNLDTNETRIVGEQTVSLQPGFYHLGALNISYAPEAAGSYDLTLGDRVVGTVAVDEAITDIQVVGASVSAVELVEGEELFVTGSLYQAGTVAGSQTIELTAENVDTGEVAVVASQETGELQPGFYHLGALNVSYTPDTAGTYELTLGDRSAGTIEVEAAYSDVQVIAASTSEVDLVASEEAFVTGSIYQAGTIAGSEAVDLVAENVETGEEVVLGSQASPELAPGWYHLGALNVTYAIDEAGTYDLRLGDRHAGTVEVEAAYSDVQVIAAGTSAVDLVAGEEAFVTGSIYQAGTIVDSGTIELTAENVDTGEIVVLGSQESPELAPGWYHLGALNVSYAIDEPGTYDLRLGDRNAGTVEVEAASSDIIVIAAGTSAVDLFAGEEAFVTGSIYQAGTIAGSETVDLVAENVETGEEVVLGSQESPELAPGWYYLGALNVSYAIDEPGTYDLRLGDRDAGTVEVEFGTVDVDIVSVDGQGTGFDLETGEPLVYTSHSATVAVHVKSDVPLDEVTLLVQSRETTYAVSAAGTHVTGDRWTIDVPLADVPDDGRYGLTVVAVDAGGTGDAAVAEEVLVIDRNGPSMSVSVENVDSNDATVVVVDSNEPLEELSSVTVELPTQDGSTSTETITMIQATDTQFIGTLEFEESGEYTVTVVGVDHAGNEGTDTASVIINTGFTLNDGEIIIDKSGTSIAFEVADDADEAINAQELFLALSENSINPNVGGGDLGVGFITAKLDSFLEYHLEEGTIEHATISMAVDETAVPSGSSVADAQIHYYDQSASQWDPVDTTVEQVGDQPFLVADVTHFSTYGALIADEEPPQLVSAFPTDGTTLKATTEELTVRFEYADELSGVDVGDVRLAVDGIDVTGDEGSSITSLAAEHTMAVEAGGSYTVSVTVVDVAGNAATYETTFDVAGEDDESDADENHARNDETGDDGTPGFGVSMTLLVVLVAALFIARRRR